jgi:16S rRNA (guanine966-N2)-methyltransferase
VRSGSARIVGGELGGRRLTVAGKTRPSSALLRAALASIWLDRLAGAAVLDLYAGSGAVAFELISRGAASAVLVEPHRAALAALERNLELAPGGRMRLLALPAERAVSQLLREGARFDLLFADPPYDMALDAILLARLVELAAPAAALAIERRAGQPPPEPAGWRAEGARRYGDAELHLFERD